MKKLSTLKRNLSQVWENQGDKILVFFAMILLAVVSFNAGRTHEADIKSAEVKIIVAEDQKQSKEEKTAEILGKAVERKGSAELVQQIVENSMNQQNSPETAVSSMNTEEAGSCTYIASSGSDKYHLPNCKSASRIKQENRRCFSSVEDAEKQGYQSAKCCIK